MAPPTNKDKPDFEGTDVALDNIDIGWHREMLAIAESLLRDKINQRTVVKYTGLDRKEVFLLATYSRWRQVLSMVRENAAPEEYYEFVVRLPTQSTSAKVRQKYCDEVAQNFVDAPPALRVGEFKIMDMPGDDNRNDEGISNIMNKLNKWREKGKQEAKIAIAEDLIEDNFDDDYITKHTSLSPSEITKLRKKLKLQN